MLVSVKKSIKEPNDKAIRKAIFAHRGNIPSNEWICPRTNKVPRITPKTSPRENMAKSLVRDKIVPPIILGTASKYLIYILKQKLSNITLGGPV